MYRNENMPLPSLTILNYLFRIEHILKVFELNEVVLGALNVIIVK